MIWRVPAGARAIQTLPRLCGRSDVNLSHPNDNMTYPQISEKEYQKPDYRTQAKSWRSAVTAADQKSSSLSGARQHYWFVYYQWAQL